MEEDIIETDLLIVGAGPAGASLACFLSAHGRRTEIERGRIMMRHVRLTSFQGKTGIMIASAPGCAETPRAHITNMAALGEIGVSF